LATQGQHVELDDVDQLQQPLGAHAIGEVVQRQPVALSVELDQGEDEALVEQLVLEDLEPDHRRHGSRQSFQYELARDIDPGRLGADDPLEPDLGERVEHDRRRCALVCPRSVRAQAESLRHIDAWRRN
jgi:hypothetical protein